MPLLFSYGTLRDEAVQTSIFGRRLEGSPDELVGFESEEIEVEEDGRKARHAIVRANGRSDGRVSGVAFEVTEEDLALADSYEPPPYTRISTTLASGRIAWVYADTRDAWAAGAAYEDFMGRWSRRVARRFVPWLAVPAGSHWLDVGCGTGALTAAICDLAEPASVVGSDPSAAFVEHARGSTTDARASFVVAGAGGLPERPGGWGCVVSSFALNFFPDPGAAVREMRSLAADGGVVGACVWDYADGMDFLRRFWDAAAEVSPGAVALDEGKRFPLCRPGALEELFREARLSGVRCEALDIPTVFASFEDYWRPLLGGTGPAPTFVASLDAEHRTALASRLSAVLPRNPDGSIALGARAWAVRGSAS